MAYRFALDRADHGDLASGFVLRSAPGFPGFPVRLATEIFQRARRWTGNGPDTPSVLWDPLCGSGYLATVLGLLHGAELSYVLASDASERAVDLAARNLALLTADGLDQRRGELVELATSHGKTVHERAVAAVDRLIRRHDADLPSSVSVTDVFQASTAQPAPDLVIGDVPYGEQTHWHGVWGGDPVVAALRGIARAVPPHAVISLSARTRKIDVGTTPVLERFRVGLRAVVLVRAGDVLPG